MLKAEHISYTVSGKSILKNIDASFDAGSFSVILGPNGSGKSSLLKILSGEISAYEGKVYLDVQNLSAYKKGALAKRRAVLSQLPELSFPLTVSEVVLMGRYPHFDYAPGRKDEAVCEEVMYLLYLQSFAQRNYLTLSGGEKQRVQYARVLAQIWDAPEKAYLFLDEPLTSLDVKYQKEFLNIAQMLTGRGTTVVAVLHDINLALAYGRHFIFLKDGRLEVQGDLTVFSPSLITHVFDLPCMLMDVEGGRKVVIF